MYSSLVWPVSGVATGGSVVEPSVRPVGFSTRGLALASTSTSAALVAAAVAGAAGYAVHEGSSAAH